MCVKAAAVVKFTTFTQMHAADEGNRFGLWQAEKSIALSPVLHDSLTV